MPERVPEEFRQPYEMKGIRPGTKQVLPQGGLNPLHYNAVDEGGPRNGVMTALDDFVAEYDRPLRVLVLPVYFGLAIVVEEERLEREPELAQLLDRFESAEGKDVLLQIAESTRLQAILFQHNDYYGRRDLVSRGADRYLDLLDVGAARRAVPRPRAAPPVPRELHRARQGARAAEARRSRRARCS